MPHVENADDVDFICNPNEKSEDLLKLVETSFDKYQLRLNTEKHFGGENHIVAKIKKLGSFLYDLEDIENRNRLCWIALGKYREVWSNPYINIADKVSKYNTYIRSIPIYNCRAWSENANIRNKIDTIHRKLLRRILKIYYPKTISNSELYKLTRTENVSNFVAQRSKTHWGHILRQNEAFKDAYLYLSTISMKKYRKANYFKTIRNDFGTDVLSILRRKAVEREV